MSTKQKLTLMLFALVLSVTAVAQETIFPAEFPAPAEFNTGKVHISVLSRSEHQMTTTFFSSVAAAIRGTTTPVPHRY